MATISPTRPTRRGTRKPLIVEESDDELSHIPEDADEEFTPAPARSSPRKSVRRQTTANTLSSPRKSARARRTKTGEGIEPTEIFDPDESMAPSEPPSPTKKASPRKRKSAAPSRSRRGSVTPSLPVNEELELPESPDPLSRKGKVLADITAKALNRSAIPNLSQKSSQPMESIERVMEKPMDIVIRARAQAAPVPEEPTGPRSRMVIRQLVMTNFKSYAGRQVVGPFHPSFSAVVGPNGSGKSNVIDSLLFVFGFRASKMRQGKISALIHNSAQHTNLDYCEVEVHFQEIIDHPGGKHEIVPETEMVVSRKAFKNNSSNYYLNGRTTNFTAVTTLLKDKGIDLDHKRFLILQGEVESIAQMKPKAANEHDDGLLEYLEDIIGTSKYKTPIEEAAVELENMNEVCMEKQGRVQHVEKEKNGLEEKKNKALAFIRDENELAEKQSTLYQIYIAECEDNAEVTKEAIDQMQAQLNAELEKHAGNEDAIRELEKAYKKAAKQYEQMEKQTQELVKELAKFDKEGVKFDEKRKFITGKQKKAEKTANTSRLSASEAASLIEKHSDDIERKGADVAELEQSMQREEAELVKIRESLKGKTQGLSDQIAAKQKSLEPWNEKINQKQSHIAVVRSELDIIQEKAKSGQKAVHDANAKVESIQATREEKAAEIEQRQHEKARLEKDVRKIQDALQKLARSEPEVRSQVSSARQKAEEARASLNTSQNQSNVLKGLLRLKDSGRIDGFHGRLGNLGAIDEKFDVAISTACPALENMVVDNVEVGQQCIDHLRKNNLGRANFILLDKLAQRDLSPIQTPENVPRLFDLVKPKDKKFAPAFYSVMQNTLVAQDLQQANRIAYGAKRWRVVTLDGQLIDVSGTMSGGGTRVARGAMSSKLTSDTSKEQVQKLEAERDDLEKQFGAFQDKQRELEGSLREKQEEIPRIETAIQKLGLEVQNCEKNLVDAQKRVQDLTAELSGASRDDSQIKTLEKQIAAATKEIENLKSETSAVEAEIQELQNKIMEVGGIKLRTQKATVDGLKERIDMLNEDISAAEVGKTKNEKLKIKHEKAKADAEKELQSLASDLEKLESDIAQQSTTASESKARTEAAQNELAMKKDELADMKKDVDKQTAELNETRAVEIEMKNKLEENQKILADNDKKGRYWREKLGKLSLHDIADLEEPIESISAKSTDNDNEGEMEVDIPEDQAEEAGDAMDVDQPEPESSQQQSRRQLPTYTRDELEDKSKDHLIASIAALEEKVSAATSIDLAVIAEYRRRCTDLASRTSDLNSSLRTRDAAKNRLSDLRSMRLTQFMMGFTTISQHLKQMYQLITLGGNAELELVDSLDPFSEGILFSVMPPKKSWKNIGNLSGGEKTLSSLALVFALHVYRPTPLYVMDEIDAALDFRNVSWPTLPAMAHPALPHIRRREASKLIL
jgi:structural maintenance of chromosome 4